ncbi:hypothetical protein GY45DRAFT_1318626 [Cubamyces sp. BRFM 1775]|nr:hypothetical protein GY45DRAFT_1318626 [Cubamyces sp. BRFM 1775]
MSDPVPGPASEPHVPRNPFKVEGPYEFQSRRYTVPPFQGLQLRDPGQALVFAQRILSGDDTPDAKTTALLLGYEITARQPPLTVDEARLLWNMLRRMTDVKHLVLEDPDGLLMLIPTPELEASPLVLPKLKLLRYCMMFSIDFCHTFLSVLQEAPLESITLRYPKEYDQESDDESSDPFALLARGWLAEKLLHLDVENLKYEYFDYSAVMPLPRLATLSLAFVLDDVSPRIPILGYLLAIVPNLYDLVILTSAAPDPLSPDQQPPIQAIWQANVEAQTYSMTRWSLDRVQAGLLDLCLLGLQYPVREVDIIEMDVFSIQSIGVYVPDPFPTTVPTALGLEYKDSPTCPLGAFSAVLGRLRNFWSALPQLAPPKAFNVHLSVRHPQELPVALADTFALVLDSPRIEKFELNIRFHCKRNHPDPTRRRHPRQMLEEDDSSDTSEDDPAKLSPRRTRRIATKCVEARHFFEQMPVVLAGYWDARFEEATAGALGVIVNVSSYCLPEKRCVMSTKADPVSVWVASQASQEYPLDETSVQQL